MLQVDRAENLLEKYLQIKISNGGFNKIQEIELPSKIGRSPKHDEYTSQLALESPYISREHLLIEPEPTFFRNKRILLTDLGSSNGTFLNGKRIPPNTRVAATVGDIIQLGSIENDIQGDPIIIQFLSINTKASTIQHSGAVRSQSNFVPQFSEKSVTRSFSSNNEVDELREALKSSRKIIEVYEFAFCICAFVIAAYIFNH